MTATGGALSKTLTTILLKVSLSSVFSEISKTLLKAFVCDVICIL